MTLRFQDAARVVRYVISVGVPIPTYCTDTEIDTQTHRRTDTQTDTQTDTHTHSQLDTKTHRQADRQDRTDNLCLVYACLDCVWLIGMHQLGQWCGQWT